ncbi:hypothetical protein [Kocuria palustris]|uniref:hypothetical protein n=1 Tax=Kocuria palustris TaxID=71999 RepID=UPI0016434EF5|nr:hypothetical protein [Kocuria palustris]
MEISEILFSLFHWVRMTLFSTLESGEVFFTSIILYFTTFVLVSILWDFGVISLFQAVRRVGRYLSSGATIENVLILERTTGRIANILRVLKINTYGSGRGDLAFLERIPLNSDESRIGALVRSVIRSLWISVAKMLQLIIALPGFFLSSVGALVLLSALLAAFPGHVRNGLNIAIDALHTLSWAYATLLGIIGGVIPVALILIRLGFTERAVAKRAYRREYDVNLLKQLHDSTECIEGLASSIRGQMEYTLREYAIERRLAGRWYKGAQNGRVRGMARPTVNERLVCNYECALGSGFNIPNREYSDDLYSVFRNVEKVWGSGLNDSLFPLARVVTREAWEGLIALHFCFSSEGKFLAYRIPASNEWRRTRIRWQHRRILYAGSSSSGQEGRGEIEFSLGSPPRDSWFETELRNSLWMMAELARELNCLANFSNSLVVPGRFEGFARISQT